MDSVVKFNSSGPGNTLLVFCKGAVIIKWYHGMYSPLSLLLYGALTKEKHSVFV